MPSTPDLPIRPLARGPVLGIETSCDETAVAILDADGTILADLVLSQTEDHARFGGVVPEIAARAHMRHLPRMTREALAQAGVPVRDLAGVAATAGPGLIGGLIVGSQFAKGLALPFGLPYVAVNHLEAHALTARLPAILGDGAETVTFPWLLLLVSGGHCQCVAVDGLGHYRRLGSTVDDAVGEAFDKIAKLLGLGWPGGPAVERVAQTGDPRRFAFPRPMLGRAGCDFSFSGLKTAVAQTVARLAPAGLDERTVADVAASFQASVTDVLADRVRHAMAAMRGQTTTLVVAGGVAANTAIRAALRRVTAEMGFRLVAPPIRYCTDNAVMVAWCGIERLRAGLADPLGFAPRPRWPLADLAR